MTPLLPQAACGRGWSGRTLVPLPAMHAGFWPAIRLGAHDPEARRHYWQGHYLRRRPRQLPSCGVVVRKAGMCTLCAGVLAVPGTANAAAPIRGQMLMPGVVYSRQAEVTAHGPVVMHVVLAPKPTGLSALR